MANVYTLSVSVGFSIGPTLDAYATPIVLTVSAGSSFSASAATDSDRVIRLSVSTGASFAPSVSTGSARTIYLGVSTGLTASAGLGGNPQRSYTLAPSTGFGVSADADVGSSGPKVLSVSAGLGVGASVSSIWNSEIHLSVSSGVAFTPALGISGSRPLAVSSGVEFAPSVQLVADRVLSVSAGVSVAPSLTAPVQFDLSASAAASFGSAVSLGSRPIYLSVSAGVAVGPSVGSDVGGISVSSGVSLGASALCQVRLGGTSGLNIPLLRGISGAHPLTFAETPSGVVLMSNGIDPMIRWDAISGVADFAGVQAPSTAPTAGGSGVGTLTGVRRAWTRFVDIHGNPSNLSPMSDSFALGSDGPIEAMTFGVAGSLVLCYSRSHGLETGDTVTIGGLDLPLNGQQEIQVVDADHFILVSATMASGEYSGGGYWTKGSASVVYSSLPVPTQAKVQRIQILRTLEGDLGVAYVDVDTTDLSGGSQSSSLSDEELSSREAVTIKSENGHPGALRYAMPPSRPIVCNYQGRVFAAGDLTYFAGCVSVASGQTTIRGIGTRWTTSFEGRRIYIKGCPTSLAIQTVDPVAQTLTISSAYPGPTNPFATYLIRSAPADRKTLQWSEAANPEAWPDWNAVSLPEDNDEIVGMFVRGSYLYVAERRHLYRYQFTDDPASSAHLFLMVERGSINHRVIALADDKAYILDEAGIYTFDGGNTIDPISEPIQVIFQADGLAPTLQVDWTQDTTLWHASVDPVRTIIRWFVAMRGQTPLRHAICYNYRTSRWWLESYPTAITSSCTGVLQDAANVGIPSGSRRALAGTEARTVLVLGEGLLDFVSGSGTLRGQVSSATSVSLSDSNAQFDPSLSGCPVSIVSGTGSGQTRIVSSVTTTSLTVVQPWSVIPDSTSVYQIGGIPWEWRSGWLDVEDDETNTPRDLLISYAPTISQTSMSAEFYYNHSSSPQSWSLDTTNDGVTTRSGESAVWFDMSDATVAPGYRVFRQANHSDQYSYSDQFIQLRLSGVTNSDLVRVYQLSLRGVDQDGL